MKNAYIYFSFPALFLHELSHLFACVITLTTPFGFRINLFGGCVKYFIPKNAMINALINLSPFFNFIVAGFLVSLSSYFFIYLAYLILTYKISLPSQVDYDNIYTYNKDDIK